MDTIKTVSDTMKGFPVDFWYALSMVLAAVMIWMIQRYFSSLQETLKDLTESIRELTKIVTLHDEQIKQLQKKRIR